MAEPLLAVSGLHAGYGATEILRGVDLDGRRRARSSRCWARNGAGKSTLNRTISGVMRAVARHASASTATSIERERPAAHRRARPDPCAGRPPHLPQHDGARKPRSRRLPPRPARAAQQNRDRVFSIFPRLAERQGQRAGTLVRRRTADAGDRPRPDGRAASCSSSTSRRSAFRRCWSRSCSR